MSEVPRTAAVSEKMRAFHADVVQKVKDTIRQNDVVVVGMGWNPHVAKARDALREAEIPFEYLELGNYSNMWRERLAIKLWSGFPTFPQVYVKGTLVGGNTDVRTALADGSLRALLQGERPV
jgi:glutaredoxin-related protein